MHTYIPPRKGKTVITITGVLFAAAVVLLVLAATLFRTSYPFAFHMGAVVCLVIGIQLFTRYYLKVYKYVAGGGDVNYFADEMNRISEVQPDGGPVLKIICMQGKRENTVGGFPLGSVVEIKKNTEGPLSRKDLIKHSFDFSNNLSKEDRYTAAVLLNGEYISVTFEPDGYILNLIKSSMKKESK